MSKKAVTDFPVHELISKRWSPYGFDSRSVSQSDIDSILEAARWAASSYNEQPWSYILATGDNAEQFAKVLSCLVEANQAWAKAAPVLLICCARLNFTRNGKPNAAAVHDLGLAAGNICLEATARGLAVHQMIGILPDRAREVFSIPDGVQAVTAMAIGYAADPATLPDEIKARDTAPRQRKAIADFVFAGEWGKST
ncbi:MAG: nitroreductase family protein [Pirellulaceae bacterium]|nr:nitroreductase family protein [Pirellulaceae bacterium]